MKSESACPLPGMSHAVILRSRPLLTDYNVPFACLGYRVRKLRTMLFMLIRNGMLPREGHCRINSGSGSKVPMFAWPRRLLETSA